MTPPHHKPTGGSSMSGHAKAIHHARDNKPGSVATIGSQAVHFDDGRDTGMEHSGREKSNEDVNDDPTSIQQAQLEEYARILLQELELKNAEIDSLKHQLQDSNASASQADSAASQLDDIHRTALLDLAKKARRLTVALEKEKSAVSRQNSRIAELEAALAAQPPPDPASCQQQDAEIKVLKDKLSVVTRKLDEEKATSIALRGDVSRLTRALSAELGGDPSTNVAKAIKESSGWKGRAQQIAILRSKNQELQRKLDEIAAEKQAATAPPGSASAKETHPLVPATRQEAHKKMADDEREAELVKLREDAVSKQITVDALQARSKTLAQANKDLKAKLIAVIEKGSNDDKLIRALHAEVAHLKKMVLDSVSAANTSGGGQPAGSISLPHARPVFLSTSGRPNSQSTGGSGMAGGDLEPSARLELERLRELRREHASQLQAKTERIAHLEIALQHERRVRSQWQPPSPGKDIAASGSPLATMPPSEREALMAENNRLRSKIDVLRDEVKVLQAALDASAVAKERELSLYCRVLDEAKKGTINGGRYNAGSPRPAGAGRRSLGSKEGVIGGSRGGAASQQHQQQPAVAAV